MAFKNKEQNLSFAYLALAFSLKHNRSLKFTQLNMSFGNCLNTARNLPAHANIPSALLRDPLNPKSQTI